MKRINSYSILIILILCSYWLFAEDSPNDVNSSKYNFDNETFAIHPKLGLLYNLHNAGFRNFQGSIDCGLFKEGSGLGWNASLYAEKLFSERIFLGIGFGYFDRSGKLSVDGRFASLDTSLNQVVDVITENTINAKIGFFEINPEIRYIIIPKLINGPLRAAAGLRFAFPISGSFEQREGIKSPENAVFNINGLRTRGREIADGSINTLNNLLFGFNLGLENLLSIGNGNYLSQQIAFDYFIGNIVSDADWSTYALRFDLGLRFSIKSVPPPIIEPEPIREDTAIIITDIPVPEQLPIGLKITLHNLNLELHTGNELLASPPLINAVFFERNSDIIPSYYNKNKGLDSYFGEDPVYIHQFVMPRIADIIKKNPNSSIVIEGTSSGNQYEPEGLKLGLRRAKEVEKVFLSLGIPTDKLTTTSRIFPRFPSNQDFEKGVIENQRVDIIVKNAPLQEYVNLQRYAELNGTATFNAELLNFPEGRKATAKTSLTTSSKQVVKSDMIPFQVKQRIADDKGMMPYFGMIESNEMKDYYNSELDLSKLPRKLIDLNVDNFEAVLTFDYDQSFLSDDNKGLLKQLSEFLPENFTIILFGSADTLGAEYRNIQLEKERADEAEKYIKSVSGNKFIIERSTAFAKYPQDTEQGRFLNRCIRIRLRKPTVSE